MNPRLESSTMLEALVAMVIVAFISGLTVLIALNMDRSLGNRQKTEALIRTDHILNQAKREMTFLDQEFHFDGMAIHQKILPYQNFPQLRVIELEAFAGNDNLLLARREIIDCSKALVK